MAERAAAVYAALLDAWNRRSAADFAAHFAADGSCVGFDGSTMNGRAEIESTLGEIFASHPTATYVHRIREVRPLEGGAALLRAVVGMVPRGGTAINPALNAIQSVVFTGAGAELKIALLQNTPAAFHGRPDRVEALIKELSEE